MVNLSDRLRGLDFLSVVNAEEAGLDPNLSYDSCPSSSRFLKEVFSDFNFSPNSSIIDIGCGKGSAMRTMLKYPFVKVDGIEFSRHLATITIRNFKRLHASRTQVFIGDATKFDGYDAYDFVYFFNPFSAVVMAEVMESLIRSLQRSDRELIIIYLNPTCDEVIVNTQVFRKAGIYCRKGNWLTVYSNRDYNHSMLSANAGMYRIDEHPQIEADLKAYLQYSV
jgi:precorrin-6B methylase 2